MSNIWGPVVILSDGDVVLLDDVEQRYLAEQYVLIDDKLRILSAVKTTWASRVTTVFPRQGHYVIDRQILARFPPADVSVVHIGDVLNSGLSALLDTEMGSNVRRTFATRIIDKAVFP